MWLPTLREAEIDEPLPRVHDLRHTAVNIAISTGANVRAVQVLAGHADPAITLRVFSHLFDPIWTGFPSESVRWHERRPETLGPRSGHDSDTTVTPIQARRSP